MEMHQVRYFLALCETLNFTRAAERCNVSQPSLTRAIRLLEEELGGELFRRERSRTHLSELGRTMRPYLDEMLVQVEAARERARKFTRLAEAPLKIGVMCTLGPTRLIDLMRHFQEGNPGVDVHLLDAPARGLKERLDGGDVDLALFAQPDEMEERYHALPLFSERFVIAVSAAHRFARLNAVTLAELHGERYLSRLNCEYGQYMLALYDERGVQPVRPYRSERDDWIQSMALAGLGFAFMPEHCISLPGLVTRPLIEPAVLRTVHLVTVRGRPHASAVGAFVREAMRYKWTR